MNPRLLRPDALHRREADELLALCTELLDALADCIDLAAGHELSVRRRAHLDYLRALQRHGHATLARAAARKPS